MKNGQFLTMAEPCILSRLAPTRLSSGWPEIGPISRRCRAGGRAPGAAAGGAMPARGGGWKRGRAQASCAACAGRCGAFPWRTKLSDSANVIIEAY